MIVNGWGEIGNRTQQTTLFVVNAGTNESSHKPDVAVMKRENPKRYKPRKLKCQIPKRANWPSTVRSELRRMAGLVFLLVFWVLAGACQRHGVGGFLLRNTTTTPQAC